MNHYNMHNVKALTYKAPHRGRSAPHHARIERPYCSVGACHVIGLGSSYEPIHKGAAGPFADPQMPMSQLTFRRERDTTPDLDR